MNQNLYALFESRFPKDRSEPLLLLEDGTAISYADADAGSARYAALLAGLGLAPGERVAVQVEKSVEALLLYLRCLRAGLAYLPLNSAYREGEVGYFLENAEPAAVVAAGIAAGLEPTDRLYRARTRWRTVPEPCARQSAFSLRSSPRSSARQATLPPSSHLGTTGRSKGDDHPRQPASNALHRGGDSAPATCWCTCCRLQCTASGRLPRAPMNGTAMRFHAKFDPGRAIADFAPYRVHGVPGTRDCWPSRVDPAMRARACARFGSAPRSPRPTSN
jgi:malonyl-CoA/methylmalonyl-CoA synthetase